MQSFIASSRLSSAGDGEVVMGWDTPTIEVAK